MTLWTTHLDVFAEQEFPPDAKRKSASRFISHLKSRILTIRSATEGSDNRCSVHVCVTVVGCFSRL